MNIFKETSQWAKSQSLPLFAKEVMTSTNDVAKEEALKITEDFKLYLTEHQTQGRGRFDRTWSDDGKGGFLLSTWSYRAKSSPSPVVTPRIGLAVVEAFSKVFPDLNWSLKAPNDILLDGKKLCGLLTEVVSQGGQFRLIIGLGANVLQAPTGLKTATSLVLAEAKISSEVWAKLLNELKNSLDQVLSLAHVNQLEPAEGSKLLDWLNQNPNLKADYSKVGADGSLQQDGKTLNWMDL